MNTMLQPELVDRVADLARLALTDDERALMARQLGVILDYINQIESVGDGFSHTDGPQGASASSPILVRRSGPSALALREDLVTPSLPRDVALANAPSVVAGQIRVPAFLPEDV